MLKKIIFWPKITSIFKNEEGTVIIAALLVLVLLTIIGIASNNISNTEVKIATHELIHQRCFYAAEGATGEALDDIDGKNFDPQKDYSWIYNALDPGTFEEFRAAMSNNHPIWDTSVEFKGSYYMADDAAFQDTGLVVVQRADPEVGMDAKKRYHFAIYGRCAPPGRGSATIEIGFIKPF